MKRAALRCLRLGLCIAALSTCSTRAVEVVLDAHVTGRVFQGLGAVSAGASSRLLIDYPETQRSQILDYLFKPNYGAALPHLKVEIGGEVNSTDGTEPTHQRTATDTNYNRGYEWWLMQQAVARNPNIQLDSLAWGAPGWIGGGNYYSTDMINYICNFLNGAKKFYNLNINLTGVHNESAYQTSWIKSLRNALNANGLARVKIIAADEWSDGWTIVTNIIADVALSNAIYAVGAHYPGQVDNTSPAAAKTLSQPLWSSEEGIGGATWAKAQSLAQVYNRNYIIGKMTKDEIWSPITSYYDILPAAGSGLMKANTPWSGAYQVTPAIWATAHTTQFAQPGWTYLEGGASALLAGGGSFVTLMSSNNTDYSIVIETTGATAAQSVTFHLTNGLSTGTVHVWRTTALQYFTEQNDIAPMNGAFTISLATNCIYTLTTTTGQAKGGATSPAAAPFPLPFKDDFESYAGAKTPKFFSDQAGTFETFTRAERQGQCLRQVLLQIGLEWAAEWQPYTLIGDASWQNYDVSADVLIETNSGLAFVMGRVGSVPGFSDALPRGYWLALNTGSRDWELHSSSNLLASGSATVAVSTWHNLRLAMMGSILSCYVDGVLVTNLADYTYSSGMAGLGCGWHGAQFDNFTLRQLHRGSFNFALTATASTSSVWKNDPNYAASMANDNDSTTRWNSAFPTLTNEWQELDFPAPTTFDRTVYSEFGGRVSGYQLQHWNGSAWITDVNGGTIGDSASDIFPTVTATRVRLYFTNFVSTPSIYEFGVYDDAPATHLATAATASASSVWSSSYTANLANDNNFSTRWNAGFGTTNNQWLELDWPAPVSFNRTVLSQFADRVTSYAIQHWNGSAWVSDVVGGQLGASKTDVFPTVTASSIRFVVLTATNVPSIREFQVFHDPPSVASIRINEWMINNTHTLADPVGGQFQPWFELYNAGATNVNLTGYLLGGAWTNLYQFQIPAGYSLAASNFMLVWTDGQTGQNTGGGGDLHVNFSLPQSQCIVLLNATGQLVDGVDLFPQAADTASGSKLDGDPAMLSLFAATPRQSNNQIWSESPGAAAGTVRLSFNGFPFAAHRILTTTNLQNPVWTTLATVWADGLGALSLVDSNASVFSRRFYRAISP